MSKLDQWAFLTRLSEIEGSNRSTAETRIHEELVGKLVVLASRRINDRFQSKIAPKEVVQSVFASFFDHNRRGDFEFSDWNSLWSLLVKMTVNKCSNRIKEFQTLKRNVELELSAGAVDAAESQFYGPTGQPSVHEVAVFNETLDQLFDDIPEDLQRLVSLKLQGYSNFEISEEVGCSERTVYRNMKRIQKTFEDLEG